MGKKKWIKGLIPMLLAALLVFLSIPQTAYAGARDGIAGNGLNGIWIDINASPYTDQAQIPTWGAYAYGGDGCAWFASSRVTQLTGKCTTIYDENYWYNTAYAAFGFSRGRELRNEKALACYQYHVSVVELVDGGTVTVSEGGMPDYPNNGCCVIQPMTKEKLESNRSGAFLGYVYLGISNAPAEVRSSEIPGGSRTISDGEYHIVSALEGSRANPGQKCLTISGLPNTKDNNGASAQLWSVFGLKDHVFTVTWLGNGFYKIKLKDSDNKCLDVENGSTLRGINVHQWEDNGTIAQQWRIDERGDGNGYEIRARCSGYYLDVDKADTANGTNVKLWEGNGSNAQRWYFVPWGGSSSAKQEIEDGEYQIVSDLDYNKALNVADGNLDLNANRDNAENTFEVAYLGNGYYEIINKSSGLSMDVYEALNKNGTNVQLYNRNDTSTQQWLICPCGDGSFFAISKSSGMYLDVADTKNVTVWAGHGGLIRNGVLSPWVGLTDGRFTMGNTRLYRC